jgi:hypothetical protein
MMSQYLSSRVIEKQIIENEQLTLSDKENNYLGPDLVLKNCDITLQTGYKCLHIRSNVQILGCQIVTKKNLKSFSWLAAEISECFFAGKFTGNEFGHWPEYGVFSEHGRLENCDFSQCILDGCRFTDCNMSSIKLPSWPCFAILNPCNLRQEIESIKWPEKLRFWATVLLDQRAAASAITWEATRLAKMFDCTVDDLRKCLEQLPGALL